MNLYINFYLFISLFQIIISLNKNNELNYIEFSIYSNIKNNKSNFFLENYKFSEIYFNITLGNNIIPIFPTFENYGTYICGNNISYDYIYNESKSILDNDLNNKELLIYKNRSGKHTKFYPILNSGYNFTDKLFLNKKNYILYNFLLVNEYRNSTIVKNYLGLKLGINSFDNRYFESFDFLKQLKNNNLINKYFYSIIFENKNFLNYKGKIIFGEELKNIYKKKYENKNLYSQHAYSIDNKIDWGIRFEQIKYDDIEDKLLEGVTGKFSLDYSFIICSSYFWKYLKKNFFEKYINKSICFEYEKNDDKYFYCNKKFDIKQFKNITFNSNFNFKFTYKDLFLYKNNNYYFLISSNNRIFHWMLGKIFLQKYQFIFNHDGKLLMWYDYFEENKNNNNKINIFINIFSFIIIILLLLIIFHIKKKITRKKKIYEMNEDYEYILKE